MAPILAAALLMVFLAGGAIGQESFFNTHNGAEGFRPKVSQAEGVECVFLFCVTSGLDDDDHAWQEGPVEKELIAFAARETRRLFPNLKYVSVNKTRTQDLPPNKHLNLDLRISGSGLMADVCATHVELRPSITDPMRREHYTGTVAKITTANNRRNIVSETKKAITRCLETVADGWFEPHNEEDGPLEWNYRGQDK